MVENENAGWYGVVLPDQVEGWIYGELVKDNIVLVPRVKIRSGPGLQHNSICELNKGDAVKVYGREGDWVKVTAPSSSRGWIRKADLVKESPVQENTSSVKKEVLPEKKKETAAEYNKIVRVPSSDVKPIPVSPTDPQLQTSRSKIAEKKNKEPGISRNSYTGTVVRAWWTFGSKYALVGKDALYRSMVICYFDRGNAGSYSGTRVVVAGDVVNRRGMPRPLIEIENIEPVF